MYEPETKQKDDALASYILAHDITPIAAGVVFGPWIGMTDEETEGR